MSLSKKNGKFHRRSGQTILELVLSLGAFFGILVFTLYIFSIFDVAQNQTALLRTQAMMELGGHSFYGTKADCESLGSEKGTQNFFSLGDKTEHMRVDLEKIESFDKAVSGEMELDVVQSLVGRRRVKNGGEAWGKYGFPKGKTKVSYFVSGQDKRYAENPDWSDVMVSSRLGISHNRCLEKTGAQATSLPGGLFSGSIHLNDLANVMKASNSLEAQKGLVENAEALKEMLRKLGKEDPSLSTEAKKVAESINVGDGVSGSAVNLAISSAISTAISFGLSELGKLIPTAGAEGSADSASGGANAGASGVSKLGDLFNPSNTGATLTSGETYMGRVVNSVTNPLVQSFQGAGNVLHGASMQSASGLVEVGTGISKIGGGAVFYAGLGGVDLGPVGTIAMVAGAPGQIHAGLSSIDTTGMNFGQSVVHVSQALQQVAAPVANIVTLIEPEMGVPFQYVNMALSVPGAIDGMVKGIDALGSTSLGGWNDLKAIGEVTSGLGVVAQVGGAFSGEENLVLAGGVMQAGGAAMIASADIAIAAKEMGSEKYKGLDAVEAVGKGLAVGGTALSATGALTGNEDLQMAGSFTALGGFGMAAGAGLAKNIKEDGMSVGNPAAWLKEGVKNEVQGFKDGISKFKTDMAASNAQISDGLARVFGPHNKVDTAEARAMAAGANEMSEHLLTSYQQLTDGVKEDTSSPNLARLKEMLVGEKNFEAAVVEKQLLSAAKTDAERASIQKTFADLNLNDQKMKLSVIEMDLITKGIANGKTSTEIAEGRQALGALAEAAKNLDDYSMKRAEYDKEVIQAGAEATKIINNVLAPKIPADLPMGKNAPMIAGTVPKGSAESTTVVEPVRSPKDLDNQSRMISAHYRYSMAITHEVEAREHLVSANPDRTRSDYLRRSVQLRAAAERPYFSRGERERMLSASDKILRMKIYSPREAFDAIRASYENALRSRGRGT